MASNFTAYVRPEGEVLPEQAPPRNSRGLVGWMQDNLFSTWSDRIITALIFVSVAWMGWSMFSSMVLRANTEGVTQGEGTLARALTEMDDQLAEARALARNAEREGDQLVLRAQRELRDLSLRLGALDLGALPTVERLRQSQRVLPENVTNRIDIAASKLPLSAMARVEIARRQFVDVTNTETPDLSGLTLTAAEEATLRQSAQPWSTIPAEDKALYQSSRTAIVNLLRRTETVDGAKNFVRIDVLQPEIDAIIADAMGEQLLERATLPARTFDRNVGTLAAMPMSIIPSARVLKIRKDFHPADRIAQYREAMALAIALEAEPSGEGLRFNRALDNAKETLTDGSLFLREEMPVFNLAVDRSFLETMDRAERLDEFRYVYEDYSLVRRRDLNLGDVIQVRLIDPLPDSLRNVLSEMDFWSVGVTLVDSAADAGTTPEKAPLVLAALEAEFADAPQGSFAEVTRETLQAYEGQDLEGIATALEGLEPILAWAQKNNGSNWAIISENWERMLWGTYPPEKLWRVLATLVGLVVALLPIFVPACRGRFFIFLSAIYPLFLLFMLSGLSIRIFGWSFNETAEGASGFATFLDNIFSDRGKVIQAGVVLIGFFVAWILRRGPLGKTAGPALVVAQMIAAFYFVIMIWGTVINPPAAQRPILVDNDFTGFLIADHPMGADLSPQRVQDEIDALNAQAENPDLAPEEAQALRVSAAELRPALAKARGDARDFDNAIKTGEYTFVVLPFVSSLKWGGLLVTMVLGIIGMAASLPIGIVLAFGRQSTLPIVRWFSTGLIEVTRGVPLIALLLVVTFVLPKLLPEGADYPKLGLVLLAICLFGGVYQAEVIRGGLQSLPKGQYEAAQAMGLTFWQESRLITLPQALKAVIPAIVNTFIGLFKDTTLVIVVGIVDLLTITNSQIGAENAWNTLRPEALLVVSAIFFALMFSLSRYSLWLEQRLATEHK